ncbi:MAG: hypothetical protein WAK22_18465 [Candidatus Sulfotelmatobacter sp.]
MRRVVIRIVCYGMIVSMTSCLGQTSIKAERVSPVGNYRAELSEGDTGAVGGWMSSLRVTEVKRGLWARLLGQDGTTVFGGDFKSAQITFEWKADNQLEIECSRCDPNGIQVQKNAWRDITISYRMDESSK